MSKLKKYFPPPETIPAIMILGALGAVIVTTAAPKLVAMVAAKTPRLQKAA